MLKHILSRNQRPPLTTSQAHFHCISGMVSRLTATRTGMWSCESHSKQQISRKIILRTCCEWFASIDGRGESQRLSNGFDSSTKLVESHLFLVPVIDPFG